MTSFSFELVTPERVLWSGAAEAVSMRTDIGEVTFLANHASLAGALDITVLRIVPTLGDGDGAADGVGSSEHHGVPATASSREHEVRAAVHGGFVHVDQNKVVIAAPVAELAEEIDVERARRSLEAAEHDLSEAAAEEGAGAGVRGAFLDPSSPEAARRRATVRLEAAGAVAANA